MPKDSGDFEYEYFIKVAAERKSRPFGNHPPVGGKALGNNRLTIKENSSNAEVIAENHYYPLRQAQCIAFGMTLGGQSWQSANYLENRYLYNGKEMQDNLGLDWYDYGARFYDAQIGRWHSVDPIEQYESGYIYCGNDPINKNDPTGMWAEQEKEGFFKTVIKPDGRIIYHDDVPDKNIYISPYGSNQGADGNTDGLQVFDREQSGVSYQKGSTLQININTGAHSTTYVPLPPNGNAYSEDETIFEIICFVYGGAECFYKVIKSGGKYFFQRVFSKETANVVDDIAKAPLDDFTSLYRQQVGVVRAPKNGTIFNGKPYKQGQIMYRTYIDMGRGGFNGFRILQEGAKPWKPAIMKNIPWTVGVGLAGLGYLYYHVKTLKKE